jgi:hypothetical protein
MEKELAEDFEDRGIYGDWRGPILHSSLEDRLAD